MKWKYLAITSNRITQVVSSSLPAIGNTVFSLLVFHLWVLIYLNGISDLFGVEETVKYAKNEAFTDGHEFFNSPN